MKFDIKAIESNYGTPVAVVILLVLILLGLAIIFCIGMSISYFFQRRRKRILSAWGEQRGFRMLDTEEMVTFFRPIHKETSDQTLALFPWTNLFKGDGAMALNVLEGRVEGLPAKIFEYRYMTGSGKSTAEHFFTVVSCEFHAPKSYTGFRRYGWRDPLLGKQDIVTHHASFDDAYYVYADEWGLLQNEFTPDLAQGFVNGQIYDLVIAERRMTACAKGRLKTQNLDALVAEIEVVVRYLLTKY